MPEASNFHGISIQVFRDDHGPPHFHAEYSGARVQVQITPLTVLRGQLPPAKRKLMMQWAALHETELLEAWDRAQRHEAPGKIAPLG